MTIDPKIISRIQKLLSLGSNNDQTHEAEAALKKAASLAEEYGLALSDINKETGEISGVEKATVNMVHQRHNCWAYPLASIIADCFDCQPIISRWGKNDGVMIFIGTPTDIEMTCWYYKLIRLKTIRGAASKFNLVKDQKMYGRGVVATMQTRLKKMFKTEQEKIRTPETTALVLVKKDAVNAEVKKRYPNLQTRRSSYKANGSVAAYMQGKEDGNSMGLHRGSIDRNNQRKIA